MKRSDVWGPSADVAPTPRKLQRIPEPEWPENIMQYRGLVAIQARRDAAFSRALCAVLVFYGFLAVGRVLGPSGLGPLVTAGVIALAVILASAARYHQANAASVRCPRCSFYFHSYLRRRRFGPIVSQRRRCGHCGLNLDTVAPSLREYFHRLFGVPDREPPPLTQKVSTQLKAWRQRAETRAPRAVRIGETLLVLTVFFAALFVAFITL